MNSKLMIPIIALSILLIMGVYFLINPSYEKSIRAKYYYGIGDYKEALLLSKEAFALNVYNRMAATINAQSITALKYVSYIKMGQKYMKDINEIATHEFISDSDKAKIKMICEIMLGSYIKLAPSVITDEKLIEDSADLSKKFEKLLEKVNKQI